MHGLQIKNIRFYFIYLTAVMILFCAILSQAKKDTLYEFPMELMTTSEDGTLSTQELALRSGEYVYEISYQAKDDTPVRLYITDDNVNELLLSKEETSITIPFILEKDTDVFSIEIAPEYAEQIEFLNMTLSMGGKLLYFDTVYWAVLFLAGAIMAAVLFAALNRKHRMAMLMIGAVCAFSCLPLFHFTTGWDTWGHLLRIESVKDAFELRQLPVFLFPRNCNGFGQLGAMYSQVPLYPEGILRHFHVSIMGCYKTVFLLSSVATAFSCYYAVFSTKKSYIVSTVVTILYLISPYRIMSVYCRHAMGELIAMIFFPFVFVGLYHLFCKDHKRYWWMLMTGYCGMIQSHVISVLLVMVFSVLVGICNIRMIFRNDRIKSLVKIIAFTLLLNIWYLIPFFTFTLFGTNNGILSSAFEEKAATLKDMLKPVSFSFDGGLGVVGIAGILCAVLAIIRIVLSYRKKEADDEVKFLRRLSYLGLLFLWAETVYFPWKLLVKIPFLKQATSMIQFPCRLLLVAVFVLVWTAAETIEQALSKNRLQFFAYGVLIFMTFCSVSGYIGGIVMDKAPVHDEMYGGISRIEIPENYPKGADEASHRNKSIYPYSYEMQIQEFIHDGCVMTLRYTTPNEGEYIDLPVYYFPGYAAKVLGGELPKGQKLKVEQGAEYRVRVHLPKSLSGTAIKVWYRGTNLFFVGYVISTVSFLVCIWMLVKDWRGMQKEVRENHDVSVNC